MKKVIHYIVFTLLLGTVACNTDLENIGYMPEPPYVDYEAIRAYKATDYELLFGWFGGWNAGGASMGGSLKTLPDSVDLVSMWGGWQIWDFPEQIEEMRYMQEVRGTRFLATMFTPSLGQSITPDGVDPKDFWGWDDDDKEIQKKAYQDYADSLCRLVLAMGFDGMDWDNEVFNTVEENQWMFEVISKYMGPLSGTDKLFCIDGYFWRTSTDWNTGEIIYTDGLVPEMYKYVDYFISQAYNNTSYINLDNTRFPDYTKFWLSGVDPDDNMTEEEKYRDMARKFIVTEDFEKWSHNGGQDWTPRPPDTQKVPSSLGFAGWKPVYNGMEMQKGGAGVYHMELDYGHANGEYYFIRQMIQIMNPAGGASDNEGDDE